VFRVVCSRSHVECLIAHHLASLDPADPLRRSELVHHGRLLWAEGLEEGRRLLLAERLWRAASALMRRSRWQHAAALFKLLDEAYAGKLGTLLERRDAQFQQARLARERAACAHARGDLEQTVQHLGESAQPYCLAPSFGGAARNARSEPPCHTHHKIGAARLAANPSSRPRLRCSVWSARAHTSNAIEGEAKQRRVGIGGVDDVGR
jgi:hypothetical protein